MESFLGDIPPSLDLIEVKKLQELVRCLQIQNEQLRSKYKTTKPEESPKLTNARSQNLSDELNIHDSSNENVEFSNSFQDTNANPSIIDHLRRDDIDNFEAFKDNEMINIEEMDMSDDESWLYIPPSPLNAAPTQNSFKWLQQNTDIKEPPASKLTTGSPQVSKKGLASTQPNSPSKIVKLKQTSFSRSKFLKRDTTSHFPLRKEIPVIEPKEMDSELVSSSPSSEFSDVMEIARQQEESLRLDTPKKHFLINQRYSGSSSRSSISDADQTETYHSFGSGEGPPPVIQPSTMSTQETNTDSDYSTPPESPYSSSLTLNQKGQHSPENSSQHSLHFPPTPRSLPRMLGNISDKAKHTPASAKSESRLPLFYQSRKEVAGNQHNMVSGLRKPSILPTRPCSTTESRLPGISRPVPKSALPRSTSVPRPSKRSNIPFKSFATGRDNS